MSDYPKTIQVPCRDCGRSRTLRISGPTEIEDAKLRRCRSCLKKLQKSRGYGGTSSTGAGSRRGETLESLEALIESRRPTMPEEPGYGLRTSDDSHLRVAGVLRLRIVPARFRRSEPPDNRREW